MPNWCYTTYIIEGESSASMYENLQKRESSAVENWNWLGHFVRDLGGAPEEGYSRGWINSYEFDDESKTLTLYCETAWCECGEWRRFVLSKCEDLIIRFVAEECGMNYYVTNMPNFEYQYVVETDGDIFDFRSAEEVLSCVCEFCECEVPVCEDFFEKAEELAQEYNEKNEDEDKYIFVHHYEFVED